VRAPNADYPANYDLFRGGGRFWSAINVIPDFPSAAQAILNGYEEATGERLDGVILADPFALQALLGIVDCRRTTRLRHRDRPRYRRVLHDQRSVRSVRRFGDA
jgi:hypothetical protein